MNINKLSTGIEGLDTLFHGGIQLTNFNHDNTQRGLIIALKGTKGCNKTLLAMQLMHGISCALNKITTKFISLNKSTADLSDMYYDMFISKLINTLCVYYLENKLGQEHINKVDNLIKCFFCKTEKIDLNENTPLIHRIAKRAVYYNTRTNRLHYRRTNNNNDIRIGDDSDNVLYTRNPNMESTIKNFREQVIQLTNDAKESKEAKELINILKKKYIDIIPSVTYQESDKTAIVQIQEIIKDLSKTTNTFSCLVIDGFSKLTSKELSSLPYTQMEKLLKKSANVSILVFDDRNEVGINSDIVIDMRRTEAHDEEYVYYELQISKSVFQSAAFGWHQYKKRDTGIDVFPSIHMLLSKRNYLPYQILTMQNNILQETYEEYLETIEYKNFISNEHITKYTTEDSEYYKNEEERNLKLLANLANADLATKTTSDSLIFDFRNIIFGNVLYHSESNTNYSNTVHGWEDHLYSTAIIGNPNSHKRQLAIAGAFHAAKQQEHTIFVLFDKNVADMRRRMRCPMLKDIKKYCKKDNSNCLNCNDISNYQCPINNCYSCYKYIHFFQIRMGCISAEEFFDALLKQINYFSDHPSTKKTCHIVIDDLQKIDYSFPFLKKTPLFLSALVTLCRQNYAELKIICDKRANLVGELCSLSDNVICIYKNEDDINNLTIYMERNFGGIHSSGLAKYTISNINKLFIHSDNCFDINKQIISANEIGSMKEYWRKTYNIIPQKHSKTKKKDSNIDSKN